MCPLFIYVGFQEKVKAGSATYSGSGFGGKGLERLDEARDLVKKAQRKVIIFLRFVIMFFFPLLLTSFVANSCRRTVMLTTSAQKKR